MTSHVKLPASALNAALHDSKMEVMNFLNEIAVQYPKAISFAPNWPQESYFEVTKSLQFIETFTRSHPVGELTGFGDSCAGLGQYGRTNGIIGTMIAKMLRVDEDIQVESDDIVVTVGCQEALCLCLLTLCGNPNDVALVPDPAYAGISGAARVLGIEVAPVPFNDEGLDLFALQRIVSELGEAGKHVRMLYLSPDFSNPTGITVSLDQREILHSMTRRLGIVIVEDHAYSYFQYDGKRIPAMKSAPQSDHVVYLGSFSKSVYPGLRVGYIATTQRMSTLGGCTTRLSQELSKVKSMLTVNTSPLCQAIIGGLLLKNGCSLKSYVAPRVKALQENRDAMLAALELNFPATEGWCRDVHWNKPAGGFFLSLQVPFTVSADDLTRSARDYGVLWTPMSYFYLHKTVSSEIRLAFSYVNARQIEHGISGLARLVKQRIREMSQRDGIDNATASVG